MGFWKTVQKMQDRGVPPCSMIVAAAGISARMGGQDKLFAELSGDEKNAVSHRGNALRLLTEALRETYTK